jgi:hypothetical protein
MPRHPLASPPIVFVTGAAARARSAAAAAAARAAALASGPAISIEEAINRRIADKFYKDVKDFATDISKKGLLDDEAWFASWDAVVQLDELSPEWNLSAGDNYQKVMEFVTYFRDGVGELPDWWPADSWVCVAPAAPAAPTEEDPSDI